MILLLLLDRVDEESLVVSSACDDGAAASAGVSGTLVSACTAVSFVSLSAGCRSGNGVTTDLSPSTIPLSKSRPCRSSLYPISPGLDGKGPACGLESLVDVVGTATDEADAVDAIGLCI